MRAMQCDGLAGCSHIYGGNSHVTAPEPEPQEKDLDFHGLSIRLQVSSVNQTNRILIKGLFDSPKSKEYAVVMARCEN